MAANAAAHGDGEELRIDPSDGQPYDQQSFLEVYGGLDEWNAAKPAERVAAGRNAAAGGAAALARLATETRRPETARTPTTSGAAAR